ncbi:MAG: anion transporter [Betaproteobacteria bacterium]|nr:anion transporter [Betaproteobacteria bacterium]
MTSLVVLVFLLVYLGMLFGGLPFLRLDRTGIALLGAIVLVASRSMSVDEAYRSLHAPTLILLFSFMVISAQLRLGGFYPWVTRRAGMLNVRPSMLLGTIIAIAAALSAVFSNDVVCLAIAPVLAEICLSRRLNPIPFLIATACAANIGSAATLIGNPQSMLIGQTLNLSFGRYLLVASLPVVLSLFATWALIVAFARRQGWIVANYSAAAASEGHDRQEASLNRWQTGKGLAVSAALFACFLFAPWPRELMALAGAGLLLTSRSLHSRKMLGLVDWQLLILFMGLFVVNHAMQQTGLPSRVVDALASHGFDLRSQGPLLATSFVLSNVVSNVPAVMLLLPTTMGEHAGTVLALSSTLAGNLLIVGSIANIIVVNEAARNGIRIDWVEHAKLGVPVSLISLAITSAYLWLLTQ